MILSFNYTTPQWFNLDINSLKANSPAVRAGEFGEVHLGFLPREAYWAQTFLSWSSVR